MPPPTLELNWADVEIYARQVVNQLCAWRKTHHPEGCCLRIYGVPNGGIHAAQAVNSYLPNAVLTTSRSDADVIVDDLLDSGATRNQVYQTVKDSVPFYVLFNKQERNCTQWVSWPWERMQKQDGPQDNVRRILQYIGDDPTRPGLLDTPDRVVRSYKEIYAGYNQDVAALMRVFEEPNCDEMVLLKDIEFYSTCEHHMQPFFGKAHIAYIPNGRVIGVSKLARILEVYSRRLQIQERLTGDIVAALDQHLTPLGAACVIQAKHFCMVCRGVGKQNSTMVSSKLSGVFKSDPAARAELFNLIGG